MSCSEVMELMQRYLDHDLAEMEQQRMVSHFNHCPECASMFERLQQLSDGLESLPDVRPPFSIVDSILPRLDELEIEKPVPAASPVPQEPHEKVLPLRKRRPHPRWVYAGTAAAALFVGAFLFQTLGPGGNTNTSGKTALDVVTPPPVAQVESKGGIVLPDKVSDESGKESKASPAPAEAGNQGAQTFLMTPSTADSSPSSENLSIGTQSGTPDSESSDLLRKGMPTSQEDSPKGITSSIAINRDEKAADDTQSQPPSSSLPSGNASSGATNSGTGTFIQPGEITQNDSLGEKESFGSNSGGGLFLGGNIDVSRIASPNAKYVAVVESQRVVIRDSSGGTVFQSPVQWEDSDSVQLTEWANNYQLLYVVSKGNGSYYEYMIDLALKKELTK
ncbi:anti-sigma factor [Gorillibacterium sp. CAU 1737]|uniref:anti-sigma factor family protein n=1 Tax=Gorillibacterium sp. CAU 1737 TaxID=3140362 RepID=UPI00326198DE